MDYDENNVFAKIIRGELPAYRVYETDEVLAFMDLMPRGEGHVLLIPKETARNILDVAPESLSRLMDGVQSGKGSNGCFQG